MHLIVFLKSISLKRIVKTLFLISVGAKRKCMEDLLKKILFPYLLRGLMAMNNARPRKQIKENLICIALQPTRMKTRTRHKNCGKMSKDF